MMFPKKLFRCTIFMLLSAMAHSCGTSCYHTIGASSEAPPTSPRNVTIFARCHTACVDQSLARSSVWPSISTTSLQSNCDTFSQVIECRRGCVERGGERAPRVSKCIDSSLISCQSEEVCGNNSTCTYEGTRCEVQCPRRFLRTGCTMGKELFGLDQDQASPRPPAPQPQAPLSAPALVRSESPTRKYNAGVFNLSVAEQVVMGQGDFANATGFLFKIEANQTSHFIFKMSLDGSQLLDLGNFACTVVNVSFAAVNGYGVSTYSPPREVCVHGETHFPSQPTNLRYSWVRDPRPDFPWHAVINISWDRPEGYQFVDRYSLTLFSASGCGIPHIHSFLIDADATSFVLMARNTSQPPLTNSLCKYPYRIFLQSKPSQSSDDGLLRTLIVEDDPLPSPINLTCNRIVNETTGNIAVLSLWTVGDDPRTLSAIDHYSIHVTLVEVDNSDIWIFKESLLAEPSVPSKNGSGSYVVYNIQPQNQNQRDYKIRISVNAAIAPNSTLDSSFLPDRKECLLSAAAEPPNPINNESITVHDFAIRQGQLHLNLSWEQPELVYGNITKYAVRITRDPVYPGEEPQESAIAKLVELPTSEPFCLIDGGQIYVKDNTLCLYAQVRVKNNYLWSEWSNAVTLVRHPSLYPNCIRIPQPSPTVLNEVKQSVPLYVYVAAGVGGCTVIMFLMLIVIVVKLCKRHRMKKDMERVFRERNGYQNPMFIANRSGSRRLSRPSVSYKTTLPRTDKWEIPAGHVIIEEWLGEGCFGEVRKGIVKGPIPNSQCMKTSICVTVAVKLLKSSATGSERTDFLHEIDTMKKIAKGNSPHVVGLVGCVTIQEPLCLITEFVKHGDLLSYLQTIRKLVTQRNHARKLAKQPEPYLVPTPQNPVAQVADDSELMGEAVVPAPDSPYAELGEVEPVNLISFAYQIAHGMEYLSSLDIVHRDLACRNILVGENKVLKISDFGMAREVAGDEVYVKTSKGRLPWKWMAIESIINREFTSASDVWAYGVVLWEIATLGGFPYPMIPNSELLEHLKRGHRLESSENCSQEVYKIMLDCWSDLPADRPTFAQLKAKFDMMLAEDNPYIQFDNINTCESYYNGHSNPSDENSVEMSEIETSEATGMSVSSSATLRDSGICSSGYDYLKPRIPEVFLEESLLHPITNPYVDTPTKLPYDSAFDLDIIDTQQTIQEDPESGDPTTAELCEAV